MKLGCRYIYSTKKLKHCSYIYPALNNFLRAKLINLLSKIPTAEQKAELKAEDFKDVTVLTIAGRLVTSTQIAKRVFVKI